MAKSLEKYKKIIIPRGSDTTLSVNNGHNNNVAYTTFISKYNIMIKFQTKKELLRYLGKNEDDRKLVDRMVARGEVRLEGRIYVLEEKEAEDNSADLEYLNREYEKLEGLLDYSLRKCYNLMKKNGLVGSEDTYDDFYENITAGYGGKLEVKTNNEVERGNGGEKDLGSIMNKFGIKKASDLI